MPALLPLPILHPVATDADLLGRFVRDRDEAAFAELVRRFGPLVLGVCRRVIPDAHLAEDAFQAAFVVLARKASDVRPATLPHWLYGVAQKVALRARTMAGRRAKRETLTAAPPEVAVLPPEPDDTAALDDAITGLPVHYREAVILCELSGVSRTDAATRLGIAEGTLSSRLAKARKRLAAVLSRKGIGLPAVLAASVPPALCAATVRAATDTAPAAVSALADGVTRIMLLSKLKLSAALGTLAVLLLAFAGVPTPDRATAAPMPKDAGGLLWVYDPPTGELIAYTPDGKKVKAVTLHDGKAHADAFHGISADGRYALFSGQDGKFPAADKWLELTRQGKLSLHQKPLHGDGPTADTGIVCGFENRFADTKDGIVHCQEVRVRKGPLELRKASDGMPKYAFTRYDADGKNPKVLDVPDTHQLLTALRDGELLTETWNGRDDPQTRVWRCRPGVKPVLISGEVDCDKATLSPDGKTILAGRRQQLPRGDWIAVTPTLLDVAKGKPRQVEGIEAGYWSRAYWSPDGKRIAVEWNATVEWKNEGRTSYQRMGAGEIAVCDADGDDRKVVLKLPDPGERVSFAGFRHLIGWFPDPEAAKKSAPVPKDAKDPGVVWLYDAQTGELLAYRPNGDLLKAFKLPYGNRFHGLTPDGTRFVYAEKGVKVEPDDAVNLPPDRLHVRDAGDDTKPVDLKVDVPKPAWFGGGRVYWSPDGTEFITTKASGGAQDGRGASSKATRSSTPSSGTRRRARNSGRRRLKERRCPSAGGRTASRSS